MRVGWPISFGLTRIPNEMSSLSHNGSTLDVFFSFAGELDINLELRLWRNFSTSIKCATSSVLINYATKDTKCNSQPYLANHRYSSTIDFQQSGPHQTTAIDVEIERRSVKSATTAKCPSMCLTRHQRTDRSSKNSKCSPTRFFPQRLRESLMM